MPGPRNQKKKKAKKDKRPPAPPSAASRSPSPTPAPPTPPPPPPLAPRHVSQHHAHAHRLQPQPDDDELYDKYPVVYPPQQPADENPIPSALLKTPFIYDPGNGPRVKDPRAFMASRFAAPPSLDDELCAEFAEEAVLQMLCTVLPEETALILWYNKSRRAARICPACQRLYRLGDVLPDHLAGEGADSEQQPEARSSPYLAREQELSGLCSPVCFILAAYNYPGAIRSTWGRTADELDDATWALLDAPAPPGGGAVPVHDLGLGMLLKMTRCHDLGLAQLFFPDLDVDGGGEEGESEAETVREVEVGVAPGKAEAEVVGKMERLQVAEA